MAKSWQFTRSRRYLSQAVMWLILGATIALAAMVDNHRSGPAAISFEKPQTHKGLTAALPHGWKITRGRESDGSSVFDAMEPQDDPMTPQRTLAITREVLGGHD